MNGNLTLVLTHWEAEALLAAATVARVYRQIRTPVLRSAETKLVTQIDEAKERRTKPLTSQPMRQANLPLPAASPAKTTTQPTPAASPATPSPTPSAVPASPQPRPNDSPRTMFASYVSTTNPAYTIVSPV